MRVALAHDTTELRRRDRSCHRAPVSARGAELQQSVVVDFPRGRIESRGGTTERVVVLSAANFASLFELPAVFESLADSLAEAVAREALEHLAGEPDPLPDEVARCISLGTASRGMGLVEFERWGDLLCAVWRDPPASSSRFEAFVERFLARVVGDAIGCDAAGAVIYRSAERITVLLGTPETCDHVRELVAQGVTLPRLVDHLVAGELS